MHAHVRAHQHTHARTHTRTHARTRAHAHAHAHARTRTPTPTPTRPRACTRTHARIHARTRTHTRTHPHAHAHTHTPARAHTHAHAALDAEQALKQRQYDEQARQREHTQRHGQLAMQRQEAHLALDEWVGPAPAPLLSARSALDKLFAVLDMWEARRLRPALRAWYLIAASFGGASFGGRGSSVVTPSRGSSSLAALPLPALPSPALRYAPPLPQPQSLSDSSLALKLAPPLASALPNRMLPPAMHAAMLLGSHQPQQPLYHLQQQQQQHAQQLPTCHPSQTCQQATYLPQPTAGADGAKATSHHEGTPIATRRSRPWY